MVVVKGIWIIYQQGNLCKDIKQISNWIFHNMYRKPQNKEPQPKPELFTNPRVF